MLSAEVLFKWPLCPHLSSNPRQSDWGFFSVLVIFELPKTHQAERAVAWLVSVFLPVLGKARALLSSAAFAAFRSYEALTEVLGSGATGLAHP